MSEIKFKLSLDIRPFKEGLLSAVKMGTMTGEQLTKALRGLKIDTADFDNKLTAIIRDLNAIDREISPEIDAGGPDKAAASAEKVKKHTEETRKKAPDVAASFAKWGLALQGVKGITQT